jgi:hypothetical protein
MKVLRAFVLCSLLAAWSISFSQSPSSQLPRVDIQAHKVERMSRDEVRFRVRVTNTSARPIFLSGISDELGKRLYPVYLELWRNKEGWVTIFCMDTPPPHVLKLSPGETADDESWAKLPMSVICRNRIAAWEGRFRFRVEYFDSEKQARAYIEKLFSPRWKEARALAAVSEPFEIPPVPDEPKRLGLQ